jgi:hypothetical protein
VTHGVVHLVKAPNHLPRERFVDQLTSVAAAGNGFKIRLFSLHQPHRSSEKGVNYNQSTAGRRKTSRRIPRKSPV